MGYRKTHPHHGIFACFPLLLPPFPLLLPPFPSPFPPPFPFPFPSFIVSLQSLSGHTSAVSSVAFDAGEEFVIAGSEGGTVKMWDLEAKKGM